MSDKWQVMATVCGRRATMFVTVILVTCIVFIIYRYLLRHSLPSPVIPWFGPVISHPLNCRTDNTGRSLRRSCYGQTDQPAVDNTSASFQVCPLNNRHINQSVKKFLTGGCSFSCFLEVSRDGGAEVTSTGRSFHVWAPATTNKEGATSNIRQSDTGLAALPIHEGCNLVILTTLLSLFNCLCVVWLRCAKLPEFSPSWNWSRLSISTKTYCLCYRQLVMLML